MKCIVKTSLKLFLNVDENTQKMHFKEAAILYYIKIIRYAINIRNEVESLKYRCSAYTSKHNRWLEADMTI